MRKLFLLAVLAATFAVGVAAQPTRGSVFVGETLRYEAKIKKLLQGFSIAELEFTTTRMPESGNIVIKSEAISKGTLLKLLKFSFTQQYESIVDPLTFRIVRTKKHDVQKSRVRDSDATFDHANKRVTYVETDPQDAMRPPRTIASTIPADVHDMISAIFAARLRPLKVGDRFEFSVSDSGLVYKVPFAVTARERQNTVLGKIWCFRIEPEIFGPGRLIEQKGRMVIWMAEQRDNHLPVRAEVNTPYGKVDIRLRSRNVSAG